MELDLSNKIRNYSYDFCSYATKYSKNRLLPKKDDELILPPEHYWFLWKLSWLSLFSCAFAIYRGHYDLACVPGGVWLTSINYWRRPDYSWRRYLDISYVHLSLLYQTTRAYNAQYALQYYIILSFALACFPMSVYFHKKNQWLSTILHGMLHVFANISNFVLYAGFIEEISPNGFHKISCIICVA
jgi:hypothetical protein